MRVVGSETPEGRRYAPLSPLELDPDVVRAETPAQFRLLLARIAKVAGLTAGQIAVKSGIPRSQAYALVKELPVLPSKPDQVLAFLHACTVAPSQVDEVMELWQKLSETSAILREEVLEDDVPVTVDLRHVMPLSHHVTGEIQYYQSVSSGDVVALVRHVLDDERRTSRALRLVGTLGMGLFVLLAFTGYVLTLLPTAVVTQLVMGTAVVLGVVVLVAGVFAVTLARRRRRLRLLDG